MRQQFHPDTDIRYLTEDQRREILAMQELLFVITTDIKRVRVLRSLINRGIAVQKDNSAVYSLTEEWQKAELQEKPAPLPPEKLKNVAPDPPRQWERPPAIYSNMSQEERIDYILKNY
ncbi:MAG TPA: hypothetical protein VFE32_17295 [Puia sp.]|jgi:hypothetical protein|nr:hypothetical protein [Puia sp.]